MIAPNENGVSKHNDRDDTCVAVKATPPFFNVTANVKRLGKRRDWQQNKDAGLFYPPPSSLTPQHPERSSKNPTTVFIIPTL